MKRLTDRGSSASSRQHSGDDDGFNEAAVSPHSVCPPQQTQKQAQSERNWPQILSGLCWQAFVLLLP